MTMKLKKTLQIILALCLGLWMISCQQEHIKLTSPNGKLSLEFTLDEEGAPRYCLRHMRGRIFYFLHVWDWF